MKEKDHYKTLRISPDSDEAEIRSAYRTLAKKYHPDAGEGSSADRFRDIQLAYDVLSDPEQRAAFDRTRLRGTGQPYALEFGEPFRTHSSMRPEHLDLRGVSTRRGPGAAYEVQSSVSGRAEDRWADLFSWIFQNFLL